MSKPFPKIAIGVPVALLLAVAGANYINLQRGITQVEDGDSRNKGIEVFAHYKYFVNPNVLVYDLRNVAETSSPIDVTRVLLQFAERQKDNQFANVELTFKGEDKFVMEGAYFRKLGQEYSVQNAAYTLRTLPQNLYKPDGSRAFGEWTGGLLGVLTRQMEDFGSWHRAWYIDDLVAGVKGGLAHAN
jgi:hypothetical protein